MIERRTLIVGGLVIAATGATARFWPDGSAQSSALPAKPRQVAVSRFGSNAAALQRAIDSGAAEILVDGDVIVDIDVTLRSDQTLRFVGGKLRVDRAAKITHGVLYASSAVNVVLIGAVIDASLSADPVAGIRLVDVTGARVEGGRLTRAGLMLESYDNKVDRRTEVSGTTIDMQGARATAVYISGLRGVAIDKLVCANGFEGVGIYNHARAIRLSNITASRHRQDGFLVYAGQDVVHSGCRSHGNGQSGFTTQRDMSGNDTRQVTWTGCEAWDNVFDGFDIRGAKEAPWQVDTGFVLTRCTARENGNCGFYIVMAEGTRLTDCSASRNDKQNLFVNTSSGVVVSGFRSVSGATKVASGPNKAGVLVFNSGSVDLRGVTADNTQGVSQDFGVAFTGRNPRSRLSGSRFAGNHTGPVYAEHDVSIDDAGVR